MKSLVGLFVISCWIVWFVCCFPEQTGCGFPGIPLNGVLTFTISGQVSRYDYSQINESIRNGFWPVETLVDYECETEGKFFLTGSRQRICLDDGTWGGQLPFCDENVAYGRKVFVNNTANGKSRNTTLLTDGIVASGTSKGIYLSGKSYERLILEFQSPVNVRSVIIHSNGEDNWQENCQNPIVLSNDTEVETRCKASATVNNSIQISCPDDGISSRKLTIFHTSKPKCFIVEIQVFVRPKNSCGFPQVPINGRVLLFPDSPNPEAASYRCSSGFQLTGLKDRKCIGRSWSGQPTFCHSTFHVPTTTTTTPKTSVTYSTLTTPETTLASEVAIHSTRFTSDEKQTPNEINTTETINTTVKLSSSPLAMIYITVIIVFIFILIASAIILLILWKRGRIQFNCRRRKADDNDYEVNNINGNSNERPRSVLLRNDSFFSKTTNSLEQNDLETGGTYSPKGYNDSGPRCESIYADIDDRFLPGRQESPIYKEPPPTYSELSSPKNKFWNLRHQKVDSKPIPKPRISLLYATVNRTKRPPQRENGHPEYSVQYSNREECVNFNGVEESSSSHLSKLEEFSDEEEKDEQNPLMDTVPDSAMNQDFHQQDDEEFENDPCYSTIRKIGSYPES